MESTPDYKSLFLAEQRLREKAELRLREEQRLREEEQRLREEEQRLREEEQRRNQSTTLPEYLDACHELLFQLFRAQDRPYGTKGDPFNAYGKPRPEKLCEWVDAPNLLEEIWLQVLAPDLVERRLFSPRIAIEDRGKGLLGRTIGSELDLRIFQSLAVETPVASIIGEFHRISEIRQRFRLKGTVQYETHANSLTKTTSHGRSSSKRRRVSPGASNALSGQDPDTTIKENSSGRRWRAADMFCLYNTDGTSSKLPILIAEYKAPHKFRVNDIRLGLREMDLDQITLADLDGDLSDAEKIIRVCCQCVGALVTQAFAYMINWGLRYGYVSTGEAYIFLYIKRKQPGTCYYFLSTPATDVGDRTGWNSQNCTQENSLHLTALSQVLAFTLLAMKSDPEDLSWRNSALNSLAKWELPTNTLISQLAELRERCPYVDLSPDATHRVANDLYAKKSPIRLIKTRNTMRESPPSPTPRRRRHSNDSDDNGSGTGDWPGRPGSNIAVVIRQKSQRSVDSSPSSSDVQDSRGGASDRYCTHQCLLGLVRQQPIDPRCPNVEKHGSYHQINATTLVHSLLEQFNKNLGGGLKELYIHGAVGALYKVTLLSHGYTMVAKGTTSSRTAYLEHEASIYKHLDSIQGVCVPVYVGAFVLNRTFLYLGKRRISYMMLMSYGGVSVLGLRRELRAPDFSHYQEISKTLRAMGVRHNDFEDRNLLYDTESGRHMVIDFERAELEGQGTETIQPRSNKRKRSHDGTGGDQTVLKDIRWNQKAGQIRDKTTVLER
ncbi:hypothetical protein AJ79_07938 [Helicocarpus griseus UAMH5409]|uniref:Protein kinase domain-containing protein n=1 Tax=Helicocarpus griseus UAMH5409 TaxID=1447875 RepID=A0A2B7WXV3_9EURO|nr:hypothetical protein AJ79_07938 [Helicocarpus griseus UAMH5409]